MRCATAVLGFLALSITAHGVPIPTSMCHWFAYDAKVPVAGYCTVNQNFFVAVSQEPTTYIGKSLTRVYGRSYLCGQLGSQAACNAQAARLGCYWGGSSDASLPANFCSAQELTDWNWFSRHTYVEAPSPAWMVCAGSPWAQSRACDAASNNATRCAATAGCTLQNGEQGAYCTAKFLAAYTPAQRDEYYSKVSKVDPSVAGNCGAAQYLRGVTSCAARSSEAACKAAAGSCTWNQGTCGANLYGDDAWGKAIAQATATCSAASANTTTCARTPRGAIIQQARIAKYLNYSG